MSPTLTTMLGCHWSARRIQRYLDADPSGLLTAQEVRRLESHLARCGRCSATAEEYNRLSMALARWTASRMPDQAMAERVRLAAERLIAADTA